MAFFTYKARNNEGKLLEGHIEADVLEQAVNRLQQKGVFILEIAPASPFWATKKLKLDFNNFDFLVKNKIKLKDLSLFCRQLALMLEAGVPLLAGLQLLNENQKAPALKRLTQGLSDELKNGQSFGKACAHFSKELPPLMVDMITAGEVGGFLDNALVRLADYFDKELNTREKVKTAMVYPLVVVLIAILAVSIVFTFVIPVFAGIIENMGVPIPWGTQLILTLSLLFRNYWYLLIIGVIIVGLFLSLYINHPQGKKKLDDLTFAIPILRDMAQKVLVSRFSRTLANLLHSGVPILKALEVIKNTIGNENLKIELVESQKRIRDGMGLTESFKNSTLLPSMVIQMMAVGERSGNLEGLLNKVADFYDGEIAEATERLPKLIEPIVLVILGVVVGSIVLGILLPMFNVMSSIGA